jgi:LPS-assembly protein
MFSKVLNGSTTVTQHRLLPTGFILILLAWAVAQADTTAPVRNAWLLCEPDPLSPFVTRNTGAPREGPIELSADSGESSSEDIVLRGNVVVKRGDQQLQAPAAIMNRLNNHIVAKEGIVYGSPNLAVRGKQGGLETNEKTGWFESAEYYLPDRNAQGSASRIDFQQDDKTSQLQQATYSTCDRGHEFWQLHVPALSLDQNTGRGSAKHVTLDLGDVPVFYWPYLSFPINNQRQSGFLMPAAGYNSSNGFDLTIPYYWNIAPNQDMTLAPRILTERGILLDTEYRFLLPKSEGQIDLGFIPDDAKYGSSRLGLAVKGKANPVSGLYNDLLFQYVSDNQYLNDFGNHLYLLSPSYLEQHLDNRYYGDNWNLLARVQHFQIIEPQYFIGDQKPYNRLPQLLFTGNWTQPAYGLSYTLNNELVNFSRSQSVQGQRLDFWPAVSLPLQQSFGFLIPRLSYRVTGYNLSDLNASTSINPFTNAPIPLLSNNSPSRLAPIFSTDGSLFFERPLEWPWGNNRSATLTLEPRLFYLYVPYRQQNDLPHFDTTSLVDRSYSWLFLENRFSGSDRLGDANQLTTAVSSRLLNAADGSEQLSLNIGQIEYFQNRNVTLYPGDPPQTSRTSPLIVETVVKLIQDLSLRSYVQWQSKQIVRDGVNLSYRFGTGRLFNFAYNYAQNEPEYQESAIEQIDTSVLWTFNDRWRAVGRWNYSLLNSNTLKLLGGVEYDACCWALRVLAQQYRDQPQSPAHNAIVVQLELKGLTSLGTGNVTEQLTSLIPGYQPRAVYTTPYTISH